jgi:hypothetical protein
LFSKHDFSKPCSSILFGVVARMTNFKVDVIFMKFSGQVDASSGNFACFYVKLHLSPRSL